MDIDAIHTALANPVRRQILHWLKDPQQHFAEQEHPLDMGVCCKLIDQRAKLSQSTVSAHLATQHKGGRVGTRRVGQFMFFQRNEEVFQGVLDQLNDGL